MKTWLLVLFLLPLTSHARPREEAASGQTMFTVNFHAGLMVDSEDTDVRSKWRHDPWYSYLVSAGFYYNLPLTSEFYLFGGPDMAYSIDEEEYSSNQASSYITSKYYQLLVTIGAGWQPQSLGGLGFNFYGSLQAWGQRQTDFSGHGFSKDLGTRDTDNPFVIGLTGYYAITPQWKPFIGYEYRVASTIIGGVNFGF